MRDVDAGEVDMTCPECGSANIVEIYDDPVTYECQDCGKVFDK